ncbi:hypothetical protein [Pseudoduganella umbonata]|uniref:Uncharacterized protein n=1 Tax=Pseudoduganella umbonata TaxID=864828 RepID=A0A4V1EDM4_9BURK|nr:hypothetical protein [Pseudoduganella umbonata]MBB3220960.1 hypothetical protein [Pseudoduganella umbonata]QCP11591.1 hypothetical protein FCL38_15065 [Pseudoduganella umbonata]
MDEWWRAGDSVWREDAAASTRFVLEAVQGVPRIDWELARGRLTDVALLVGAALPTTCAHAAIFPPEFAFCPECGAPLHRAAQARFPAWWGPVTGAVPPGAAALPRHVPHGLPQTALALGDAIEEREPEPFVGRADWRMPAPPNAVCVFAAADFGFSAQRLVALAYTRNVVQYWDPPGARWHVFTADESAADLHFTASAYAWLPPAEAQGDAKRGEFGIVPTARGLFRLVINPLAESWHTEPVFQAPLAASPGGIGRRIACPFVTPDGVRLWSAAADGADPEVLDVASPDPSVPVPQAGWSRPFSYDGRLYWLHEEGQLLWRPGHPPRWLPWPFPWTPRLQFGGPVRSRDGRLWQIGNDGAGYSFRALDDGAGLGAPQVEPIDGARLGFGTLLFRRGHQVKDDPWSVEDVEDQASGDALVLPLLEAVSATRGQPSGLVLRFPGFTGRAEAALAGEVLPRTLVEWVGRQNVILDEIARLKNPGDCVPFVWHGSLWLHHPSWNEIRGWKLEGFA